MTSGASPARPSRITGAAHGIGAATAQPLPRRGRARRRDRSRGRRLRRKLRRPADERLLTMAGDCTDAAVLADFHERTVATFGPVDVLFNNVGQSGRERAAQFHEIAGRGLALRAGGLTVHRACG